jgi:hypothetical protein
VSDVVTAAELAAEMRRLSAKIDAGVVELSRASNRVAQAEAAYRQAAAKAWLTCRDGPVPEREAQVKAVTAGERLVRDLAEGERVTALEALRSRRGQLSAVQSVAAAFRAEAEVARYGPDKGP